MPTGNPKKTLMARKEVSTLVLGLCEVEEVVRRQTSYPIAFVGTVYYKEDEAVSVSGTSTEDKVSIQQQLKLKSLFMAST